MTTAIGTAFRDRPTVRAAAACVAVGVVALDMAAARSWGPWDWRRAALPLLAVGAYFLLARGDTRSLGLRLRPEQGVGYWVKATLLIGIAVGSVVAGFVGFFLLMGWRVPLYRLPPDYFWPVFLHACVYAPLVEEAVYRLALCTPGPAVVGAWRTVLISGALFAALHFLYGNPGPDNFVAGFFFAWTYLKSGSILVPMGLHSLGNAVAMSGQLAAWYWWPA
jgi:membrane protease YdiL (CAAX protease family)